MKTINSIDNHADVASILRNIRKCPALQNQALVRDLLLDISQYMKDVAANETSQEFSIQDLSAEFETIVGETVGEYSELCPLCATDECITHS